ncbi:MAG TPA: tripartite tricarboxylate transporter TctB family protein [Rhodoferax sp.]
MDTIKKREIAVGAFFLVVGIGYLYLTSTIPRKQFVDAAFVPYVLAITMCLLGVLQIREAYKLAGGKHAEAPETADYRTVLKTLGLIVAYATLLEPVGFPIMTVVYLFAQFVVLTPVDKKISYVTYGAIAVITSAVVYLTFRQAFDMILPVGLLNDFID